MPGYCTHTHTQSQHARVSRSPLSPPHMAPDHVHSSCERRVGQNIRRDVPPSVVCNDTSALKTIRVQSAPQRVNVIYRVPTLVPDAHCTTGRAGLHTTRRACVHVQPAYHSRCAIRTWCSRPAPTSPHNPPSRTSYGKGCCLSNRHQALARARIRAHHITSINHITRDGEGTYSQERPKEVRTV